MQSINLLGFGQGSRTRTVRLRQHPVSRVDKEGEKCYAFTPLRRGSVSAILMNEATQLLEAIGKGDDAAAGRLLPMVYEELRRLAAYHMAAQPGGHTLQATALVHEAYLRMTGTREASWENRAHFFRAAAQAMRQVLIENARRKASQKRGGGNLERVDLHDLNLASDANDETLLVVHEALDRLAQCAPIKAELVKLRFFIGLSNEECGQVLRISEATVKRYWEFSRAWLLREIRHMQN